MDDKLTKQTVADMPPADPVKADDNGKVAVDKTESDDNGEPKKLNITIDDLDSMIEGDDKIKKWYQSRMDKRVTEAIKTYSDNHTKKLEQEIENKIREELLPAETPEQKRIKELERKQADIERKAYEQELENFAIKYANSLSLDRLGENIDYFINGDEDLIKKRFDWLKERDQYFYDKGRNSFLRENTHSPQSGDEEKLMFGSMKELQAWLQKNPGPDNFRKIQPEYHKLTKRAK